MNLKHERAGNVIPAPGDKILWKDGELELRIVHARRREEVVWALYRHDNLVRSGSIKLQVLIMDAQIDLPRLREIIRAEATLRGIDLPKGWGKNH